MRNNKCVKNRHLTNLKVMACMYRENDNGEVCMSICVVGEGGGRISLLRKKNLGLATPSGNTMANISLTLYFFVFQAGINEIC